jgi:hypothetical protein
MDALAGRRRWLAGTLVAAAGLATFGARPARSAVLAQARSVAGFDSVRWDAGGELAIEQTAREHLVVEAEPAVLALVRTEVRRGQLHIGIVAGRRVVSERPILFRLEVKTLAALDVGGAGNVRTGSLSTPVLALTLGGSNELRLASLRARSLDARLSGAGLLYIGGGHVERQRVVIAGACNYEASQLQSREAELAIDGGGIMRVAVAERLVARIGGSGQVLYRGRPQVERSITGAGEVRSDGGS